MPLLGACCWAFLRARTDASPYLFISNRGTPIDRRTLWCAMQTYGEKAGLPPEKRKFHSLKHSIATHLLDARGDLEVATGIEAQRLPEPDRSPRVDHWQATPAPPAFLI
jgi:integrase